MSSSTVRPFRRGDRDQLTELVNAHAAAVIPGPGVSVAAVLSDLERQPGESIIGPWVSERMTLVAEQRERVAAAAHLLRYSGDERVGPDYRDAGEIRWLLFWPEAPSGNPFWADGAEAAQRLIAACLRQFAGWRVSQQHAGGELPVRGSTECPSSGRTSGRCTSRPGSATRAAPRRCAWPSWTSFRSRPRLRSPPLPCAVQ